MEIVKMYISPCDYKNCLLVSKEWNVLFSDNGSAQCVRLMKKGGLHNYDNLSLLVIPKYIHGFEIIYVFIDILEHTPMYTFVNWEYLFKDYEPNRLTILKIKRNPRLNCINLLGY